MQMPHRGIRLIKLLFLTTVFFLGIGVNHAFGAPGDLCHEQFSNNPCGFLDNPMGAIMVPFDAVIPGFGVLMLYGPIVFAIWMTTKSTAITGVVGILIAVTVAGIHPQAIGLGLMLVAVSFGIMIFQLFIQVKNPI